VADALRLAGEIGDSGVDALVVDTSGGADETRLLHRIAAALKGDFLESPAAIPDASSLLAWFRGAS
jgi:Mg-chelatase subunit ChlD